MAEQVSEQEGILTIDELRYAITEAVLYGTCVIGYGELNGETVIQIGSYVYNSREVQDLAMTDFQVHFPTAGNGFPREIRPLLKCKKHSLTSKSILQQINIQDVIDLESNGVLTRDLLPVDMDETGHLFVWEDWIYRWKDIEDIVSGVLGKVHPLRPTEARLAATPSYWIPPAPPNLSEAELNAWPAIYKALRLEGKLSN